jgi:small subunit ribosomal protein S18
MAKPQMKRGKGKGKDAGRKFKKKVSVLNTEGIDYVDWKDVNLLRRFVSDRAKVRARRVTGNDVQQQREVARAIKNAREMALIPYSNRVTTQRGGRRGRDGDDRGRGREDRGDRGDRGDRPERPAPGAEGTDAAATSTGAAEEFQPAEAAAGAEAGGEQ